MKTGKLLVLAFALLFLAHFLWAQGTEKEFAHLFTPVKNYVVFQAKKNLVIDGKAEETDWEKVQWIEDFEDIEGGQKPKPLYQSRVKMLYDTSCLYILAELEEPNIWATYDRHDMIIYHENDIEVFIDPDGDTHNYFEYEINAKNTLLDLMMPMPYRNGGKANLSWNSKGFKSAVLVDGTLNDPSDNDKKWTVEMKIPFADLEVKVPKDGQVWKVNFSRVEWKTKAVDGHYQKLKDPATGKAFPESNWVWSPPGLINMHYPERWGMIQFSEQKAGSKTADFKMPQEETIGRYIWLVYYKQQDYKRKNGRYALSFEELNIDPPALNDIPKINLKATANQFTVQMKLKNGTILSINETGLLRKNQK